MSSPINTISIESIESYDNNSYCLYLTIAIVYAFFMAFLVDRILHSDRDDAICEGVTIYDYGCNSMTSEAKNKANKCRKINEDNTTKKFTFMIIIGVAS